jgi:hypothetical protein
MDKLRTGKLRIGRVRVAAPERRRESFITSSLKVLKGARGGLAAQHEYPLTFV